MGCGEHPVELRARLPGSAHAQVDVFGSDFPAATGGILAKLGKLHLGVLVVEGGDASVNCYALAHGCTAFAIAFSSW